MLTGKRYIRFATSELGRGHVIQTEAPPRGLVLAGKLLFRGLLLLACHGWSPLLPALKPESHGSHFRIIGPR